MRFRPHGAYPFFGIPLRGVTDTQVPLEALWGIGARRMVRVLRLQGVLRSLAERDPEPWAGLALDSGFSDQTHLIRDFVRLSGSTPTRFRDELTPLARLFTASARLERLLGHGG